MTPQNVSTVQRAICPLTISAAGATSGLSDIRIDEYNNYAGQAVVGAWRWHDAWKLGIIIEKDAERAFAPVRIVRFGFVLLGSLLSITAFVAAAKIARTSTAERAAVHPLSRYEILGELGSGGMGVVYRAKHRQLGRETALKVLRSDRHNKEDGLRFDREARLAASLSNPHSVMIYDYGRSEEGEAFCVMEFLRGLTLQEVVARSGHQPIGRVLTIISQICDALAEAHGMNLQHRDIKPQNVMLSLDASVGDWAVVFDYGLAKPLEPETGVYQTAETIWAGTPMYMAPERFREPAVMDPRSDIYSVGCVIYYLLSGRPPFIECDPESLFALIISEQPISIGNSPRRGSARRDHGLGQQMHGQERWRTIREHYGTVTRHRPTSSQPIPGQLTRLASGGSITGANERTRSFCHDRGKRRLFLGCVMEIERAKIAFLFLRRLGFLNHLSKILTSGGRPCSPDDVVVLWAGSIASPTCFSQAAKNASHCPSAPIPKASRYQRSLPS